MSTRPVERLATFAIVGSLLLFGSVAAELIHPVQSPDGTTREPFLHAIYLVAFIAGWVLIAAASAGLASAAGTTGSRAVRLGGWLSVGGALSFALSTAGVLLGVAFGLYFEVMFMLFLVAFVLLIPGQALLATGRRTLPGGIGTAGLLVVAAIGLVLAVSTDVDPFHDLGLFAFDAAWLGIGLRLRLAGKSAPSTAIPSLG
jgi:hypothetical protein